MAEVLELVNKGPNSGFCETPTAGRILKLLALCAEGREIGLLTGPPGIGKTTAIKRYCAVNGGAWYCAVSPATASMSAVLRHVADTVGAPGYHSVANLHGAICERVGFHMGFDGGGRILVIDEAQHLNDLTVDELRCLHDATGVALVLSGNPAFRGRFNNARRAAFAHVTSRLGRRLQLDGPGDADVEALCRFHRVGGARAQAYLMKHADTSGGLRIVSKLIGMAAALAGNAAPVSVDHLKSAARMLGAEN